MKPETEVSQAAPPRLTHDVFISYSRKDAWFVDLLTRALQNYSAPRGLAVPKRRLNLFVDRQDFQAGNYEGLLSHYLKDSAKLVVICSPSARASHFVNQEIRRFVEFRGAGNVIPVLIAGIPNNEAAGDNDESRAFPDALCELMEMPVAIDYRNFSPRRDRVDRRTFADPWFTLLAAIYDLSRAEVELREQRRTRRRQWTLVSSAAAALALGILTFTVLLPHYREQSALAAVSEAGGKVDEKKGYVSVVFQSGAKAVDVDAALAKLPALPRVDSLDLASCDFTAAGLANLKNIHGVKELTVADTGTDDAGMKQILSLHELRKIELDNTKITAAGLMHLNEFPSLESVSLVGIKLNSAILASLASCRGLKVLSLSQCELHDQDLSRLQPLSKLEELNLSEDPISGEGLMYLTPTLKTLALGDTPLTDSGLRYFDRLRSLRSLYLDGTHITNAGLASLAVLRELRSLVLQDNPQLDDSGFETMGDLPNLQELWLKDTSAGDGTMSYASHRRTLQILSAPETRVGDAGMVFLAALPNLRELYLGGDRISDTGAEALLKIPTLRKLYLPSAQLTDRVLPRFRALRNLQELSVGGPGVTKIGYEKLKASMPTVLVLFNEAPRS